MLFAQDGQLVYKVASMGNSKSARIHLKWYTESMIYPNGVTLYKKILPSSQWVKLNANPIKRGKTIPQSRLDRDSILRESYSIVQELRDDQYKGIILLNVMLQSFNSTSFFHKFRGAHETQLCINFIYWFKR